MTAVNHVCLLVLSSLVVLLLAPFPTAMGQSGDIPVVNDVIINGFVDCNVSCIPGVGTPQQRPFSTIEGAVVRVACIIGIDRKYYDKITTTNNIGAFEIRWTDESTFSVDSCGIYIDHIPSKCNLPVENVDPAKGYEIAQSAPNSNVYSTGSLMYYTPPETECPFN